MYQNVLVSTYNQYNIINDIVCFFFYTVFAIWCIFTFHNTSQFELAPFQMLQSHRWLTAATRESSTFSLTINHYLRQGNGNDFFKFGEYIIAKRYNDHFTQSNIYWKFFLRYI